MALRLKFVVCKVLQREAYVCAGQTENIVDVVLMPQGLHNEPEKLLAELQKEIDKTEDVQDRPYDAILLGYGLCSNGIIGLSAKIPLIVPRAHDCITLIAGSRKIYQDYFDSHRGVYWYSPGWIETDTQPGKDRYDRTLKEYVEKYGEDNAEYLMEMEQGWMKEYSWATYIDWGLGHSDVYRDYTKKCAEYMGWKYDEIKGDSGMIQRLVDGKWDDEEFLTVKPGEKIAEDLTQSGIIKAE